jgi:hypothetical protein
MQIVLIEVASGLGVSIVHWVEDRVDVGFRIGGSPEPGVIACGVRIDNYAEIGVRKYAAAMPLTT